MTTVASIADLRSVNPATYPIVQVLDYYGTRQNARFPNQRMGGGTFRWVQDLTNSLASFAAEDGGIHITNNTITNGVWERVLDGQMPNVRMWGAKADGTTDNGSDDTTFIQNALSAIKTTGRRLLFPAGTYKVTGTLKFTDCSHIQGEGPLNTIIVMTGANKLTNDIFRTLSADVALYGNLVRPNPDNGTKSNTNGIVDFAHGLIFENMRLQYGVTTNEYYSASQTGAALCLAQAGEAAIIRNIYVVGGGFGVRCIGGGTPGLKVENSSFFYQAIAGVCAEGIQTTTGLDAGTGPITLSSISGDLYDSVQATNASLVVLSNLTGSASLNDLSVEGNYSNGVIRVTMPDNGPCMSTLRINGGSFRLGPTRDLLVIASSATTSTHSPIVYLEPMDAYGLRYLIRDEFGGRNITPPTYNFTQVPLHRPVQYESRRRFGSERMTRLVYGDTAYMSFTPTSTGWHRVMLNFNRGTVIGGKLAINSLVESSAFEFHVDTSSNGRIDVQRWSKNTGSTQTSPVITQARAVTFSEANIGGAGGPTAGRAAIELYVHHLLTDTNLYAYPETKAIRLSYPIDDRMEFSAEVIDLIDPYFLGDTNPASTNRVDADETPWTSTGPITLLR